MTDSIARPPRRRPPVVRSNASGIAIAALVFGIVAIVTGLVPFIGLIVGIVAVVLGITVLASMKRPPAFGIVGLIGGILATVAGGADDDDRHRRSRGRRGSGS